MEGEESESSPSQKASKKRMFGDDGATRWLATRLVRRQKAVVYVAGFH